MTLLRVERVSKAFRQYRSEFHRIAGWFGWPNSWERENWILRDISFQVHRGEAIAIVGTNGAGKSTLLKLLTKTLQPTLGSIESTGQVAAILELGMGFNPDLTGRKNVIHGAGLLGHPISEINAKLPFIKTFSEIGAYFDEPVRTYSSGMQVRVAFALATAWQPDLLIIDEALSVGDAYFQHKSFERIRSLRETGTSLLIASHDRSAICSICDRALLLAGGRVAREGTPDQVMDSYNESIAGSEQRVERGASQETGHRPTTSASLPEAIVEDVMLLDGRGCKTSILEVEESAMFVFKIRVRRNVSTCVFRILVTDNLGSVVFGVTSEPSDWKIRNLQEGSRVSCSLKFVANMGEGDYIAFLELNPAEEDNRDHDEGRTEFKRARLEFSVQNSKIPNTTGRVWVRPELEITT